MNVAEYVAEFLVQQRVRHVFGLQGGAILKLVDCMMATGKISYVQNFHEQASAFCADAYARVSENLGVALATSGPGATNLVTGIANAQLDSIPTLFITGQEFSSRLAKKEGVRSNGFQDLDIVSLVRPITKYAATITDGQRIAYELDKALHLAQSGRPGAVLLDIPIDIQFQEIDPALLDRYVPPQETATYDAQIAQLLPLLQQSRRPIILSGGGVGLAKAKTALSQFAAITNIPVALTLNGLDTHPGALGFSGLYGNPHVALAVYHADLLIVLGARLGQHQVGKTKAEYTGARIVHVDIDPLELARIMPEELSIHADLKPFLEQLNARLSDLALPDFTAWRQTIARWQETHGEALPAATSAVSPLALVRAAHAYFTPETIIAADVGQNQMWLAQAVCLKDNQRLLNSSGLGSMGYALPAAIAAKLAKPSAQTMAFMGDGGFQINLQELQLVALRQLDLTLFVLNNGTLGLIKTSQDKHFGERYYGCAAPDFACVDLPAIANAYKLTYFKLRTAADLSLLAEIFATKGPVLVEVLLDPDYPLVTRHDMKALFAAEAMHD